MSLINDLNQRNKPTLRDIDSQRGRITTNESHILNLPPPPLTANYSSSTIRTPFVSNNLNIPPPPSSVFTDTMSTFHKERLHDVLQQGLGTYVFIEHYGLIPKLNHF